jgi:hypothetical protein
VRVDERLNFQLLDNSHLSQIDIVPDSIKQQIEKTTGTIHNVGAAVGAVAAGALVIIGSALIPKEVKWSTHLKVAGIISGVAIGLIGTSYAFQAPVADTVPGVPNLFVAQDIILSAEQGWKVFGTPRIDLTITNKGGTPLELSIAARDYIGKDVNEALLEMPWNLEYMILGPSSSSTKSFYFVTDRIKAVPGPRTVSFVVTNLSTGQVLSTWKKTVNF